jgi:predicted DNA-binding transcriptional regulator AlpA
MKKPLEPTSPPYGVVAGTHVRSVSDSEGHNTSQTWGPPIRSQAAFGNCVRSLRETAAAAGISIATLRRRVADGTGPVIVRMSARRIGVRDSDFVAWLDGCANNRIRAPGTGEGQ